MNIKTTFLAAAFSTLVLGPQLKAQSFVGLMHSNLSGIHQAGYNPANIANSRHKMYVNGLTAGFGFNNDYLGLSFPFPLFQLINGNFPSQYKNPNGSLKFEDAWLKENLNGRSKNANIYLQTRGPGFMFQVSKGFSIGLQYKNTVSFQINDVSEDLARLARYGIDSSNGSATFSGPNKFQIGNTFGDNAFTINMNAYGEIGLTLAKTIINDDNFVLKAGITPKYLMGYATGYIKNRGIKVSAPGTDTIIFKETDVEYGYSNPGNLQPNGIVSFGSFVNQLSGSGFGYDIGVSFQMSPAGTKRVINKDNNYLFRGGISLLDGGHLTYNKDIKNTRISNFSGDKYFIINNEFTSAWSQSQERGIEYTDSVMRSLFNVDTSSKKIVTNLPTSLNMQFDYNVFKFVYLGANLSQDLRGKKSIGVRRPSYLMLIPRIETKLIEFALPIGLMNDYRNARVGFYLRLGPVFIGSDNLIGQLRGKNMYGTDLYFGISTGVPTKRKNNSTSAGTGDQSVN